jgi:hypothetical protein|tara:strand:+ start:1893 stop:2843 length:951 start_codon:yes stop_codon:yes gene_type:complete
MVGESVPDEQIESAPVEENELVEVEASDDSPPIDDDTDDTADDDAPEPSASAPPEHWSSADKTEFGSLPDDARDFVLRRYKSMEGDYTEKTKALADERGRFEKLDQVLAPHREQFARSGVDEAAAIAQLFQAQQFLQTQPVEALRWLAQTTGVDLSLLAPTDSSEDDSEWVDPDVKQLQQRLSHQEQYMASMQEQQNRERETVFVQQVNAFNAETGTDGKLVHPHMEAATPQMAALLKSGQAQTLQDAYDKSVWMVPEIRDQMIKSSQEQDTEEKTRRVQRAKRAGREVRSETAPVESTRPMSLRDTLRQAMAASQ